MDKKTYIRSNKRIINKYSYKYLFYFLKSNISEMFNHYRVYWHNFRVTNLRIRQLVLHLIQNSSIISLIFNSKFVN